MAIIVNSTTTITDVVVNGVAMDYVYANGTEVYRKNTDVTYNGLPVYVQYGSSYIQNKSIARAVPKYDSWTPQSEYDGTIQTWNSNIVIRKIDRPTPSPQGIIFVDFKSISGVRMVNANTVPFVIRAGICYKNTTIEEIIHSRNMYNYQDYTLAAATRPNDESAVTAYTIPTITVPDDTTTDIFFVCVNKQTGGYGGARLEIYPGAATGIRAY